MESDITWLLHRAAQRMRGATGQVVEQHGLQLRDHIVLSALDQRPDLSQVQLGKTLGLDKTTLMTQLDRLEGLGLVVRLINPRDRRARIPRITEAGNDLRGDAATAYADVETAMLNGFTQAEVQLLRRMLLEIVGDSEQPGSCL